MLKRILSFTLVKGKTLIKYIGVVGKTLGTPGGALVGVVTAAGLLSVNGLKDLFSRRRGIGKSGLDYSDDIDVAIEQVSQTEDLVETIEIMCGLASVLASDVDFSDEDGAQNQSSPTAQVQSQPTPSHIPSLPSSEISAATKQDALAKIRLLSSEARNQLSRINSGYSLGLNSAGMLESYPVSSAFATLGLSLGLALHQANNLGSQDGGSSALDAFLFGLTSGLKGTKASRYDFERILNHIDSISRIDRDALISLIESKLLS